MHSKMPFESSLIEKEKLLTQKHNLSHKIVPLNYLPDINSKGNLEKVRELVAYLKSTSHKSYVHCYLGRHRTTLVIDHYLDATQGT